MRLLLNMCLTTQILDETALIRYETKLMLDNTTLIICHDTNDINYESNNNTNNKYH